MGSAFAWHLSKAGHEVTVVARGERLARLQRDGFIETVNGDRASLRVASSLDTTVAWDGVLVTVLAEHAKPLLTTLRASKAKAIILLFNTVESLQPLREAIGVERCVFAFPSGFSLLLEGKLRVSFSAPGQEVTTDSPAWVETFRAAKLPSRLEPDMESFLRAHAAFVIPLMASAVVTYHRGAGISWAEARRFAQAMKEGGAIVRRLGHRLVPSAVAVAMRLPVSILAVLLILMNTSRIQRELGSFGPTEVRALIDGMQALAPGQAPRMLAIRPP